jgi:phosphatidate cytidylyltransferase
MAYFSGRLLGGPKLAPHISPNKTWSGFFGGLAGAVLASLLVAYLFASGAGWAGAALAVLLAIAASIGDLLESWIKRRFGHKDSGRLIPGHGGVLDRIDGLIVAAALTWAIGWLAGGMPLEPGKTGMTFARAFLLP